MSPRFPGRPAPRKPCPALLPPPPPGPLEGTDFEEIWVSWNPQTRGFQVIQGRMLLRGEHPTFYEQVYGLLRPWMEQQGYTCAPLLGGRLVSLRVVWNLPARVWRIECAGGQETASLATALRAPLEASFQGWQGG